MLEIYEQPLGGGGGGPTSIAQNKQLIRRFLCDFLINKLQ